MPDESDYQARIDNVLASLEIEGFTVTEDMRELARRCVSGEMSYDEAIQEIIAGFCP